MSIGRFVLVSSFFFSLTGCGEECVHPAETDDAPMPDAMLRERAAADAAVRSAIAYAVDVQVR